MYYIAQQRFSLPRLTHLALEIAVGDARRGPRQRAASSEHWRGEAKRQDPQPKMCQVRKSRLRWRIMVIAIMMLGFPWIALGDAVQDQSVRLLVELEDTASSETVEALQKEFVHNVSEIVTQQGSELDDWVIVDVPESQAPVVLQEIAADPNVEQVKQEAIYYAQAIAAPNDPMFLEQYGLLSSAFPQADIDALDAWEKTTGSSGVVIALIDAGVDLAHEDLKDNIWTNTDEVAGNGLDDDGNGYIDDVNGWDFVVDGPAGIAADHATHVAGIAAARGNNGVGVAGVSWNARLMSIRVLGSRYGGEGDIIEAIAYAVDNGADIINMSIAGSGTDAMVDAVEYAYNRGVVIVAAAGNQGIDTGLYSVYPACAERGGVNMVLGVGATDKEGLPAYFSNYGSCVDISAPGDDVLSTKANNRYGDQTGTSMSSPFVSGVAALYLSLNPGASPGEVIRALMEGDAFTGQDASVYNARYKGKLNAVKALGTSSGSGGSGDSSSDSGGGGDGGPSTGSGSGDGGGNGGGGGGGSDASPSTGSGSDGGSTSGTGSGSSSSSSGSSGESSESPAASKPRVAGTTTAKPNIALLPKINAAFRSVFGRNPNVVEHRYWYGRVKRGEKQTFAALVGAMAFQKSQGRTYISSPLTKGGGRGVVAGATSPSLVSKINSIHRQAYGRNPTASEYAYWLSRITSGEKTSEISLLGAMIFHRVMGIRH